MLDQSPASPSRSMVGPARWVSWCAWALIAFGVATRLRLWVAARSLWYDEAALALNLVSRSFVSLLLPLDYRQTAPPLFLWIERASVLAAGPGERSLRALSLVAGIATLFVMWRVARRLLPDDAALVALALVVCSPMLMYFSNELKPYALDAFVSVGLVALALSVGASPADSRRWVALALGGVVGPLVSTTAPFVMAGVAAYLLLSANVRAVPRPLVRGGLTALAWAVSGVAMLAIHRDVMDPTTATGNWMHAFWKDSFLTREPPGLRARAWVAAFGALKATFIDGESRGHELAFLALAAALGFVRLIRTRGWAVGALIAVPFACLGFASALRMYPFGPRLILFAAPLTALLLAAGVSWPGGVLARFVSPAAGAVATAALAVVMLMIPARQSFRTLRAPPGRQELREFIREADRTRERSPNAGAVWVTAGAELPWRFYAGDSLPSRKDDVPLMPLAGTETELAPGVLVGDWWHGGDRGTVEVGRLQTATRGACGWLIFALSNDDERNSVIAAVTRLSGRVASTSEATGAASYRVCFDGSTVQEPTGAKK